MLVLTRRMIIKIIKKLLYHNIISLNSDQNAIQVIIKVATRKKNSKKLVRTRQMIIKIIEKLLYHQTIHSIMLILILTEMQFRLLKLLLERKISPNKTNDHKNHQKVIISSNDP